MVFPSSLCCDICGAVNQVEASHCFACHHPLPSTATPPRLGPGILLNGRYRILARAGSGGFASVYKAADEQEARLVAIKEVSHGALEASDAFLREIGFLTHLTHAGLPRFYEYFKSHAHLYLVMEFIAGETLEAYQHARERGYVPLSEVLTIAIQLCSVLDYLHTQQPPIIFRDLKPANIMRTPRGQIYVIDFGIARHFKPGQARDTVALGSLGYAAPEQYGRAQTTPRADIYSLGAVLHQLLTAEDPSETPFRFSPLRANSYPSLTRLGILIESMVKMDAGKRPASAYEIQQELLHISKVWRAVMLKFWQPGPQHSHSLDEVMGSYSAGYRGVGGRV